MTFRLACGHTRRVSPFEDWLRVIREGCMRCHLEAKSSRQRGASA